MLRLLGDCLSRYLTKPVPGARTQAPSDLESLAAALRPGDVLLVEGESRLSTAIKYLTQSTWSHAALYVGDAYSEAGGGPRGLIEVDMREGVRRVGLDHFTDLHCRICRPVGLDDAEVARVVAYAGERLGYHYDLKNIIDLARYLIPTPPVPVRWRRRLLSLGSGDPTRAICSSLIAQAFQSIRYPILPCVTVTPSKDPRYPDGEIRVLYPRHFSFFMPRDFDVSPYFAVIKPTLEATFDHRALVWGASPQIPVLPLIDTAMGRGGASDA
ncbi:YiiX/YebB-like N1pC/P60 family cysteine hydrolase [Halomonas sp. YLGW01]|uniref:YiiX/YebB-like N1pC/P60 family cysteine hydrolase n=1 Tax=Halomonas sp. YLGW01 TaxID=2773308 RepID=UPI001783D69F|nr:YiiX/YebB-like N1pC/P60 family cysteine hydrolase [Halomonas sp. YLGW01]